MDPITIGTAASIIRALGIDKAFGRLLAGEKGAEVAGKVIDVAQQVSGLRDASEIIRSAGNPEAAAKLRSELLGLADKEAEREAQDRANARDMQKAALGQDDLFSKRFVYYFASAWSLFTMLYIALITLANIPEANQRYADTILGFMLGTLVATIINFFFGSSKQSQSKDVSITALIEAMREKVRG